MGLQVAIAILRHHVYDLHGSGYLFCLPGGSSLFVCVHEATHNLIFKKQDTEYHCRHYCQSCTGISQFCFLCQISYQAPCIPGSGSTDADMPNRWEAKLINNSTFGKSHLAAVIPAFQMIRPLRLTADIKIFDVWTVVNWIVQFVICGCYHLLFLVPKPPFTR